VLVLCDVDLTQGVEMIEYGLLASKSAEGLAGLMNVMVNFWNDIPFWYAAGGIALFALLIYWLAFRK